MIWTIAWALFKRFWWVIPLVAALSYGYHWIYEQGAHSRDKQVAALTTDRDNWKKQSQAQAETIRLQEEAYRVALAGLKADQATVVAGLNDQLNAAEKKAAKVKVITREVIKYVSRAADARYPVPVGFLWWHNDALRAQGTAEAAALPGGGPEDADAPSTTPLSAIGTTIRDNYAECIARGEVIKAWQDWYPKMKAAWEKAVTKQLDSPVLSP